MWKILTKNEILDIWLRSGWSMGRMNYGMNILLGRQIIQKICNNIYYVVSGGADFDFYGNYWSIIPKLIQVYSPSGWIIGWEKSLELHMQNFSIPEVLIIYTRDTAIRIKLFDNREVHFRTLVSWEKTWKKSLWRLLVDNSTSSKYLSELDHCGIELSLMEALTLRRHEVWIAENNIVQFLKLYQSRINRDVLGNLARFRYIRSINRLRVIARDLWYMELYRMMLEIIRDEWWGCYLKI